MKTRRELFREIGELKERCYSYEGYLADEVKGIKDAILKINMKFERIDKTHSDCLADMMEPILDAFYKTFRNLKRGKAE